MSSLKASTVGLSQIKQARKLKGWAIEDKRWREAASQILAPETDWSTLDSLAVSLSTWKRFLSGESIRPDAFVAFCQVLELDWQSLVEAPESSLTGYQDLVEAPDVSTFVGRLQELSTLSQWMIQDQCRVVTILGIGGVGKTALTVKLIEQVQSQFDYVVWRSLRNTPPIQNLLSELILFLSNQDAVHQPDRLDDRITLLTKYLREQRCLLVLDNLESILQSGDQSGRYLENYEGYGQLFHRIATERHQSCLVITSREKPIGLSQDGAVRSCHLTGVSHADGQAILSARGLSDGEPLVDHYKGNPLALKIAAATIQSLFSGNVAEFLQQGAIVFGDIWDLLGQQFARLTSVEQQVMYWLAINGDWVTLADLREDMLAISSRELLNAVSSLQTRSLVETSREGFTQQPVVMEYITAQFIERICEELIAQSPQLLLRHALIKAQAKDYIRDAQRRSILEPIACKLLHHLGSRPILEQHLKQIIQTQQHAAPLQPGYLGGNVLNLLCELNTDLTGYDFSHLHIRQAYLVDTTLHDVNFTGCDLSKSVFNETLTATLSVAFSPDGQLFATGNVDGIVRIWQTADKTRLSTCKGHLSWVCTVVFSPDSQMLATSSFDHTVKLWDAKTGMLLKTFACHTDWVWSVAFSPDGQTLASASNDRTVKLWDVTTGQCVHILDQHTDGVESVAFSPNGQLLASSSYDCTTKIWDAKTGQLLDSLTLDNQWIRCVAFSLDSQYLLCGSNNKTIQIWDIAAKHCIRILQGHEAIVLSIALSSDGQTLASSGHDTTVRVWNMITGDCLKVLQGHRNGVWSVAFHPDGQTLVSGSNDSMVKVWNVKTGQSLKTIQGYCAGVRSIAFSADGRGLVSGSDDKTVRIWDTRSGHCLKTLQGHTSWIWSVAISPDQRLIGSASNDCTVRLWLSDTGKEVQVLRGHTNIVMSIAFSPDSGTLISSSADQTIRLWDTQTGHNIRTIPCPYRVWAVAFSPDGQFVVSSDDRSIRVWAVSTGQCVQVLQAHTALIFSVAFSPDGMLLASGSVDQTVKLWDLRSGHCINTYPHNGGVWSVAVSPNGKWLASADQTINVWHIQTNEKLHIQSQQHDVISVAFSPDSSTIASGGQDGMIHLWNVQTGEYIRTLSNKRPYERMNITGTTGLTAAQYDSLATLGACSDG